jgi:hypothetical protein
MLTKSYYNLTNSENDSFIEFLKEASTETTQPAHENMWDDEWENKNNTLLTILFLTIM